MAQKHGAIKLNSSMFKRVNNDINGSPRYVIHYVNLIPEGLSLNYEEVLQLNKLLGLGGRKYHNKSYGGGLVFQSYNLDSTCRSMEEKLNKHFSLYLKILKQFEGEFFTLEPYSNNGDEFINEKTFKRVLKEVFLK